MVENMIALVATDAAVYEDLDAACRVVQLAFGITTGDFAGQWFVSELEEEWPTATNARRAEIMEGYAWAEWRFREGCKPGH